MDDKPTKYTPTIGEAIAAGLALAGRKLNFLSSGIALGGVELDVVSAVLALGGIEAVEATKLAAELRSIGMRAVLHHAAQTRGHTIDGVDVVVATERGHSVAFASTLARAVVPPAPELRYRPLSAAERRAARRAKKR
jgi:hypothetical protein